MLSCGSSHVSGNTVQPAKTTMLHTCETYRKLVDPPDEIQDVAGKCGTRCPYGIRGRVGRPTRGRGFG